MNAFTLSHLSHHFFSLFGGEFGILRFSDALQRRRRSTDVITSTRPFVM
jgi:hypothetical protein